MVGALYPSWVAELLALERKEVNLGCCVVDKQMALFI